MSSITKSCLNRQLCCSPSNSKKNSPNPHLKVTLNAEAAIRNNLKSNFAELASPIAASEFSYIDESEQPWRRYVKRLKLTALFVVWAICSYALIMNNEKVQEMHQISIPKNDIKNYAISHGPVGDKIRIIIEGAVLPPYYANLSGFWLNVCLQQVILKELPSNLSNIEPSSFISVKNVSESWRIPVVSEQLIGVVPELKVHKVFQLNLTKHANKSINMLEVNFNTNLKTNFPISMGYNLQPINTTDGITLAALILLGLYVLIIFEVIHRTLAAILASTMSVAVLAAMNARPTMSEILSWIDVETLTLLFSMMILVTILSESGIFDYMSVLAYRVTNGEVWPLVNSLCVITALVSCFLDSVTTALLITPVTIKLCEVMKLNPLPVLTCTMIFSNIGGAVTPIGDPPNVIIASNAAVVESGVNFGSFTLHMGVGALLALAVVYLVLRLGFYRDVEAAFRFTEPGEVRTLRREIAVWRRAAASMGSYSRDEETVRESLMKRTERLRGRLHGTEARTGTAAAAAAATRRERSGQASLEELVKQYPIKDKGLLVKSGCILLLVICVFFLHSIPEMRSLGLGWTALLGALLLLIMYDKYDIEAIFGRVEWCTLLFFASLFVLMEALAKLGLIDWIGRQTQDIIMSVDQEARLAVAVFLILWVSGVVSAFVDNLPLTTMMIRIATNLAENRELNLPLQPLVWALSFGACFGGNATLFASSSNIVCAGVAEQHGYRFTFLQFMKIGVPISITSMLVITLYLFICHVVVIWH